MNREIEKWWDENSLNYQKNTKMRTNSVHYGPYSPNEDKLRLLGNVKGKKILEIGCGGGKDSITLAKQGAICTGLDISKNQIKYAKTLAKKNKVNVKFIKQDIQTLKGLKSNNYDIVFSAWALHYIPNLTKCFKEVRRVLKKRGIFVFSFGRPFYETLSPKTLKIVKNYNKGSGGPKPKFVINYKRKISEIYDSIQKAGFILEKIIEPFDTKTEKAWKNSFWKKIYPLKLVKLIHPTIIFKARKR